MNQNDVQPLPGRDAPPSLPVLGTTIQYERFLDCVHCGLCTAACPTYVELADENDGPRGRIYLMRAVVDGRLELGPQVQRHLELCLDCRACETACPSGVQYGRLIEPFRVEMQQWLQAQRPSGGLFERWLLFGLFPHRRRLRRVLWPAFIMQRLFLDRPIWWLRLWKWFPGRLGRLFTLLPPLKLTTPALPERLDPQGPRRARVALFLGCVADAMDRQVHWATARVLQRNGCEVLVPKAQGCCGAIHYHSGYSEPARRLADQNLAVIPWHEVDAVIVNVAGCGAMLKDYGHHWDDHAREHRSEFAAKVKDVHEFLDELGIEPPGNPVPLTAAYHDACHLAHAQKIRQAPRRLLAAIPELKLLEMPEGELCCGAAGTYNLSEPEMSDRLGRRKLENFQKSGASALVSPNIGCTMHLVRMARLQGFRLPVYHPMELLDRAYQNPTTRN